MRYIFVLLIAIVAAAAPRSTFAAESATPEASGVESLGSGLLDELPPDVSKQPRSPRVKTTPSAPGEVPGTAPRFDDLGVDLAAPSGPLSLVQVRKEMQQAQSLLGTDTAAVDAAGVQQAGTAQKRVVEQLDKLIAELSKQCQGGQCQPSDQPPKPGQSAQPKPGNSKPAGGRGQTAARDSNSQLNRAPQSRLEKGEVDELAKQLWGHLPERSREQMLQSFSEEFLPEYEREIEQYYRRLSEESDETRTQ